MQEYLVDFPKELNIELEKMAAEIPSLIAEGNFHKAEEICQKQYELIRKFEKDLPSGKRFHKGATLYEWGITLLLQNTAEKIRLGYEKILFAYIEDLLDFDTTKQAREAPACRTLEQNPFINVAFLGLVQKTVEDRKARHQIPKNPEDILQPISSETQHALEKPIEISIDQVKPAVHRWLEEKGPKKKRVFIGGTYKNIAILNHVATIVDDFDYYPIMPIDLPQTTDPSYRELIHDISIEMLQECSYAIFEVTISNGHLMEIERARDFMSAGTLSVILVYQTTREGDTPTITSMLMTKDFKKRPYRNFSELTTVIRNFLP